MTIEEAAGHVGDGVIYRGSEDGVITSVSSDWVFVRYKSQHPSASGQATHPHDLQLLVR